MWERDDPDRGGREDDGEARGGSRKGNAVPFEFRRVLPFSASTFAMVGVRQWWSKRTGVASGSVRMKYAGRPVVDSSAGARG